MSVPDYLSDSAYPFDSDLVLGLADVETGGVGIISTIRTLAIALGWTEPSANLFKTPVDAAGRFLDVLLTRISATVIEWRVRNAAAVTICTRRMTLGGGAMFVHVSTAGIYAEFVQTAQNGNHNVRAFLLDMAPDVIGDHSLYVVGNGFHTNTSTNDSNGDQIGEYFAIDNGAAAVLGRTRNNQDNAGNSILLRTSSGKMRNVEQKIAINFAGTLRWAGRVPHMINVDATFNGGDERRVFIDTVEVGRFRATSVTAVNTTMREMIRKAV